MKRIKRVLLGILILLVACVVLLVGSVVVDAAIGADRLVLPAAECACPRAHDLPG